MTDTPEFQIEEGWKDPVVVLEASAGTGKTRTITDLYVLMLVDGQQLRKGPARFREVGEILAVTFTDAAVAELKERIRARIAGAEYAARTGNLDDFQWLASFIRTADKKKDVLQRLQYALATFDQSSIFTIHSFCRRVLRQFAFECGVEFDLELASNTQEETQAAIEDYWLQHIATQEVGFVEFLIQNKYTPANLTRAAGVFAGGRDIELPPAPTGHDRTLAEFWEQAQIDLKTQWASESREFLDRLHSGKRHLPNDLLDVSKNLRDYLIAWHAPGELLPPEVLAVGRTRLDRGYPTEFSDFQFPATIERLADLAEDCRRSYSVHATTILQNMFRWVRSEISQRRQARREMSFDDLIHQLHRALLPAEMRISDRPLTKREQAVVDKAKALADGIRKKYPIALIDEFQDTDRVQWEIFETLYGSPKSGTKLRLIGDPKQSIYRFRGADVHAYLGAAREFPRRELRKNYRSLASLIHALNQLYDEKRVREPFGQLGIQYVQVEKGARPVDPLTIDGVEPPPVKILAAEDFADFQYADKAKELAADAVTLDIAKLLSQGAKLGDRLVEPRDIAVLTRTNQEASTVQKSLRKQKIRGVLRSPESVFLSAEAAELERIVRAVCEPDRRDWIRAALAGRVMNRKASELRKLLDDDVEWTRHVDQFRLWHKIWKERGFAPFLRSFLWHDQLIAQIIARESGERTITNLLQIGEILYAEERARGLGMTELRRFLARKRQESVNDQSPLRMESDINAVQIVTVHRAKGLEFPIVYCPYLWSGAIKGGDAFPIVHQGERRVMLVECTDKENPSSRAELAAEDYEESARLLYVALTRAKARLGIVWIPRTDDIAQSPLAHLFFPGADGKRATEQISKTRHESLARKLHELAQTLEGFEYEKISKTTVSARIPPRARQLPELTVREFSRNLINQWRLESYSALARTTSAEGASRHAARDDEFEADALTLENASEQSQTIELLPLQPIPAAGGKRFGNLVHLILENADFANAASFSEEAAAAARKFGAEDEVREFAEKLCLNVVQKKFSVGALAPFALQDLPRAEQFRELRFHLPVSGSQLITPQAIVRAFADHGATTKFPGLVERLSLLNFASFEGFLRGTIDFVGRRDGQWIVADYKTNQLGDLPSNYDHASLHDAMLHGQYYLQYHLYAVALRRFVTSRIGTFTGDIHVAYLFCRGMDPRSETAGGVFTDVIDPALLSALDALFSPVFHAQAP